MEKILCAIPCLYNGETCLKAFKSVIGEADLLILDNGSSKDVKEAIMKMWYEYPNVKTIVKPKNIFVNAAWNILIANFLNSDYEQLVIMNSDLIMEAGWSQYLIDGISAVPCDKEVKEDKIVTEGTPGIAIHLNKKMAKMVYPIPEEIKLWFGDFYIYNILRELGYQTIVKAGYIANHWHNGSQTIGILPNKSEMIESDKKAWAEIVEPLMWKRIEQLKKGQY